MSWHSLVVLVHDSGFGLGQPGRWALRFYAFVTVFLVHLAFSPALVLLAFGFGLADKSRFSTQVVLLFAYAWFFPIDLFSRIGISFPQDISMMCLLNSFCWTLVVYPAWVLSRRPRSWLFGLFRGNTP
ncbi:MAG: hypothetical protein U0791_07910 [Gemmataceae bacterium]